MQNNGSRERDRTDFIDEIISIGLDFYPRLLIIESSRERKARMSKYKKIKVSTKQF
jgi:hypothetical protein